MSNNVIPPTCVILSPNQHGRADDSFDLYIFHEVKITIIN